MLPGGDLAYILFASLGFFVAGLVTDPGKSFERHFSSAGVQLDLHFTVSHSHAMTLSVGYAAGFKSGDKVDDEIMVSLKIL